MKPQRWPLHPPPGPLESLSSWLERIAGLYSLSVRKLLISNLGSLDVMVPELVDWDPPDVMLCALANRTGTDFAQLNMMTLAGWVPWLMDTLGVRPWEAQDTFEVYVRQNSVLLPPGEAGYNDVSATKPWYGPWLPARPMLRRCPVCAASPSPSRSWVWELPLVVGCAEHCCWLEDAAEVSLRVTVRDEKPQPVPVGEPFATLDRYTYEAIITGRVTLPGRQVHAGVWFRILRSLLDEVSLALTTRRTRARATLECIWEATGLPARGGLKVWRPYEQMDWDMQKAMLHAAATAMQLAASGEITPYGTFGSALHPVPHRHVYDGDQPSPHQNAWQEMMEQVEEAIILARTDRDAARQLLALLTIGCRTLDCFEKERSFLFGIGIPATFLPTARDLGRDDLR